MDQSLEREIRRLYSCFHSPADRQGRSFVPLADAYRRAGDLQRARLVLEEGLRSHPGFASAHVVAMRIARDVSDHAMTLTETRRVLELDPGNAEARRVLADVGPLVGDDGSRGTSVSRDGGDVELPDESWMVGDAGVWGAGTDSGLASVDPAALEAGGKRTAPETGETRAAPEAGGATRAVAEAGEERAAIPAEKPSGASGGGDAGIYTRTMGELYERQGLHAQAIAVYTRVLQSEPGDDALARHLERLRQRNREEASPRPSAQRAPAGDSSDVAPAGSGASADDDRSGTAGGRNADEPGEAERPREARTEADTPSARASGDAPRVVPIEALAPDAPATGAREAS